MSLFSRTSVEAQCSLAMLKAAETPTMVAGADGNICLFNEAMAELLSGAEDDLRKTMTDFSVAGLIGTPIDRFCRTGGEPRGALTALTAKRRDTIRLGQRLYDCMAMPLFDDRNRRIGTSLQFTDASQRLAGLEMKAVADAIARSQAVIEFEPDGTIISANENFLSAMGYELDEIRGKHHRMFCDPAFVASADYGRFWDDLRRGEFKSAEFKRIGKNGREVWIQASYNPVFDENGKVFKVVKFASDVTRARLDSANFLGQIEAIHKSQAVIEFALDGTIIDANDTFLRLTGYSLAEIKGRHHRMFVSPEERDSAAYAEFWRSLGRGEYRADQFKRVTRDGREIYIQASYNAIMDLNGKPWKVVKFAHDITAETKGKLKAERERSELINAVATGTQELNASVREISETMVKSRETANQAGASVEQADRISQRFNENAQATAGIVDMINGITDQINLLALNATIESARAGEAGRGFAVVAAEVKNLANQARGATEKITSEIDAMRASSGEVVSALLAVKREIETVQQYVTSTAAAVEEQSVVANELSSTVQRAVNG